MEDPDAPKAAPAIAGRDPQVEQLAGRLDQQNTQANVTPQVFHYRQALRQAISAIQTLPDKQELLAVLVQNRSEVLRLRILRGKARHAYRKIRRIGLTIWAQSGVKAEMVAAISGIPSPDEAIIDWAWYGIGGEWFP